MEDKIKDSNNIKDNSNSNYKLEGLSKNVEKIFFFIKIILLSSAIMMILWIGIQSVFQIILKVPNQSNNPLEQAFTFSTIFLLCVSIVFCLKWLIERSILSGKKLVLIVFYSSFMVAFFMPQIETMMFNESVQMPLSIVFSVVFSGFIACLVTSYFLVKKSGKYQNLTPSQSLWVGSKIELIWKFCLLAIIYMALYFFFGYYIAWQFPELRQYYSGSTELKGFFEQWAYSFSKRPFLPYFQIMRGFLWASVGFFATRSLKKDIKWETYVLLGLILSIGLSFSLLIPNPYMPLSVRIGHFYEALIENFIFGVIAAYFFKERHE